MVISKEGPLGALSSAGLLQLGSKIWQVTQLSQVKWMVRISSVSGTVILK